MMNKRIDPTRSLTRSNAKPEPKTSPKPAWPQIVEIMHDVSLCYIHEVVKVVYSVDREKRIVLLKRKDGFYQFRFERLVEYDDYEWEYISRGPDPLPGYWNEFGSRGVSLFGTEQEAWNEIKRSPEYITYFSDLSF